MTLDKRYLVKEHTKAFTSRTSDQDQQKGDKDQVLHQEGLQISIDRAPPTNSLMVSNIFESSLGLITEWWYASEANITMRNQGHSGSFGTASMGWIPGKLKDSLFFADVPYLSPVDNTRILVKTLKLCLMCRLDL